MSCIRTSAEEPLIMDIRVMIFIQCEVGVRSRLEKTVRESTRKLVFVHIDYLLLPSILVNASPNKDLGEFQNQGISKM